MVKMNTRNLSKVVVLLAAVFVTSAAAALSQMGPGMGRGMGMGGGMCMGRGGGFPMYNSAAETTIKGTVEETRGVPGRRGWAGMHLTVKTQSGTFDVHLGPLAYISQHGFKFAKGDHVEVIGSKCRYQDQDAIIAREIKKGDKTLTLRDSQGLPVWAGGRTMMAPQQ
jgi:hypothetical protein